MKFILALLKNERGLTFIEVLIALVLLSIIAGSFMMSAGVGMKALEVADERLTAESLARCQMELLKVVPYEVVPNSTSVADYARMTLDAADVADGYSIASMTRGGAVYAGSGIAGVPCNNDETGVSGGVFGSEWTYNSPADTGLQHITLVVKRNGVEIFTLEGNKSNRDVTAVPTNTTRPATTTNGPTQPPPAT